MAGKFVFFSEDKRYGMLNVPDLPEEVRAALAAEVASLRCDVERIFGKGTPESLALVATIDDEVQNALIRGLENLHAFHRNGCNVRAWLGAIARNLRIDTVRASQREEALFCRDEGRFDVLPASQRSPETLAMLREACRRVSDVVDRMAPASKRAFLLFHFEGLSYAEVGARLGLTETGCKDAMRTRTREARRRGRRPRDGRAERSPVPAPADVFRPRAHRASSS